MAHWGVLQLEVGRAQPALGPQMLNGASAESAALPSPASSLGQNQTVQGQSKQPQLGADTAL